MIIDALIPAAVMDMVNAMTNEDFLVIATAVLFAATAMWLIKVLRERHADRMAAIALSRKHLDAHFDAMVRVLEHPKLSSASKEFLQVISHGLGNRQIAEAIAMDMLDDATKPHPPQQKPAPKTKAFFAEVEALEAVDPLLVEDIASVLHFGKSAMLLRFPFCDTAYRLLDTPEEIRRARRPVAEIKRTSAVFSDAMMPAGI